MGTARKIERRAKRILVKYVNEAFSLTLSVGYVALCVAWHRYYKGSQYNFTVFFLQRLLFILPLHCGRASSVPYH